MHHPQINPADLTWLTETFARNARRFGGWSMEADPTDPPADPPPADPADPPADPAPPADLGDAGKKALDAMKAERNEATKKAAAAQRELEALRKQSMSDAEKAVAEAEERGKSTAAQEYGKRLAKSEVKSAAAEAQADLAGVFDFLDLARFVGDDGEPDDKAIQAFVEGLPKKAGTTTPPFNGGPRTPAPSRAGSLGEAITQKLAGNNR